MQVDRELYEQDFQNFVSFQQICCSSSLATDKQKKQAGTWARLAQHPIAQQRVFSWAYRQWQRSGSAITDFWDWLLANADAIFAFAERFLELLMKYLPLIFTAEPAA